MHQNNDFPKKAIVREESKKNEKELIEIEIDKISLPQTTQKSIFEFAYLCFISQFRLFIAVLLIVIFINVVQILEAVKTTNFCS